MLRVPDKDSTYTPPLDNGHWEFPEEVGGKKKVGFVYAILDERLGFAYIGRKSLKSYSGLSSDWRNYVSSNKDLSDAIAEEGKGSFRFFVLEHYSTKGAVGFGETWSLCHVMAPTHLCWLNTRVERVTWNVTEHITDRHKERLEYVRKIIKAP